MADEAQTQTRRSCNITDENINVQPRSDHDISFDKSSHARPENQTSEMYNFALSKAECPISEQYVQNAMGVHAVFKKKVGVVRMIYCHQF